MICNSCFGVIFIEQFIDFTFKPPIQDFAPRQNWKRAQN